MIEMTPDLLLIGKSASIWSPDNVPFINFFLPASFFAFFSKFVAKLMFYFGWIPLPKADCEKISISAWTTNQHIIDY